MKTISVIIPVYNVKKYLQKCVDSVVNQTYKNLQIILVDDGSTDGSGELCDLLAEKDSRIKVIHKKNGGLSSARNSGLENATGDYVTFLDSDDYVSLTAYEDLITNIKGNDEVVASNCYVRLDDNGKVFGGNFSNGLVIENSPEEFLRDILLHKGDISVCTKLFPRKMLKDKSFELGVLNEDLLFIVDLLPDIKKIVFTGKVGYYYLSRQGSISSGYGKAVIDMAQNARIVNDFVQERYPQLSEEGYRFALYQNMAYLLWVPRECRSNKNKQYVTAKSYLKKYYFRFGLTNRFLSIKNKVIVVALMICPNIVSDMFLRKRKL